MTPVSVDEIWRQACSILQQNLSPTAYNTWIALNPLTDFRLIGEDRAIGVITSPTAFHSTSIEKNFYAQIKEVLDSITGRNSELQFKVGSPTPVSQPENIQVAPAVQNPMAQNQVASQPMSDQLTTPPTPTVQEQPSPLISNLQERLLHYSHARTTVPQQSTARAKAQVFNAPDLFSPSTMQSISVDRARLQAQKAGLRLDYTFDTFAVSTTNEMAHAAAQAVSNQPGTAYNPLFIYGGVGVGKTHLMHAVGNNILNNNPDSRLLYCTGEDFTNEIVNAIQTKKAMSFKEKYRTVDVLLIDDVQFIAGKNAVQEEFFHTFNSLTKRFGQVILTSDRPPHEIALLEDRLRSRFEAGLMVDIQQPSFELRTAILLIKASSYHLDIPMNLAQIIASKVDSARKIEGIMKSIKSEVELKKRAITTELIEEILKVESDKNFHQRLKVKPYDVIKTVADFYNIKQVTIRGQQRVKSIVKARHIAMFFLKEELGLPYVEIGRWFSNRDHTSAMHALRKIQSEFAEDNDLRQEMEDIRRLLIKISK
jgi:chromosomal replication initiator protein